MRAWLSALSLSSALVLAAPACSDDGGSADADVPGDTAGGDDGGSADADVPGDTAGGDAAGDATGPPGGPFVTAFRAEGYDLAAAGEPRPWAPDFGSAASDLGEAVVVPLDLLGLPWESFTGPDNRPTDLPGPWLSAVNAMRTQAEATGKPVVLALTPLSPAWDTLAPDAREQNGVLVLNDAWRPYCYDPAQDGNPTKWRDVYAGYAVWAVKQFEPTWVVLGQRMNRYEETCGAAAYASVVDYVREAHDRIKALEDVTPPVTIVGVDVEDLYGFPKKPGRCVAIPPADCLAQRASLLSGLTADVLGLESYPAFALPELSGGLPGDWLDSVAALRPDLGKAIVGTSLPAASMSSRQGVCVPLFTSSEEDQASWVDQAAAAAADHDMGLLVWRSLRDLLDGDVVASCPCSGDVAICQHLDQLAGASDDVRRLVAAGLLTAAGTERLGASVWRQAMENR